MTEYGSAMPMGCTTSTSPEPKLRSTTLWETPVRVIHLTPGDGLLALDADGRVIRPTGEPPEVVWENPAATDFAGRVRSIRDPAPSRERDRGPRPDRPRVTLSFLGEEEQLETLPDSSRSSPCPTT